MKKLICIIFWHKWLPWNQVNNYKDELIRYCERCGKYEKHKMSTDIKKPGYVPKESTTYQNKKLFFNTYRFIAESGKVLGKCADIGRANSKMEYIKNAFIIDVDQLDLPDFNFDRFDSVHLRKYDTVFCLEVIEHIQNPLFFMRELSLLIKPGGRIFLSTPGRPYIIWNKHHFFEMPARHIEQWIFNPLELKIIRKSKIRINRPWYRYIGFRPLLRLFVNYTNIFELKLK